MYDFNPFLSSFSASNEKPNKRQLNYLLPNSNKSQVRYITDYIVWGELRKPRGGGGGFGMRTVVAFLYHSTHFLRFFKYRALYLFG